MNSNPRGFCSTFTQSDTFQGNNHSLDYWFSSLEGRHEVKKKCTLNTLLSTFTLYNKSKQKQRLVHFATMTLTRSELKVLDTRRATRFGVFFFFVFSLKL